MTLTSTINIVDIHDIGFAIHTEYSDFFSPLEQTDDERNVKFIYKWAEIDVWFDCNDQMSQNIYGGINTIRIRLDENNTLVKTFNNYNDLYNKLFYVVYCIDADNFVLVPPEHTYTLVEH